MQFVVGVGYTFDSSQHKTFPISDALNDTISSLKLFDGKQLCTSVQGHGSGRVIRFTNSVDQMKTVFSSMMHSGVFASYVAKQLLKGRIASKTGSHTSILE